MSVGFQAVQWTVNKKYYDFIALLCITLYLVTYVSVSIALHPVEKQFSGMILMIRAFGSCSLLLLHIILIIGPLCRLNSVFTPLLYNRRHLGIMMATLAFLHGALVTLFYHGFGVENPFVSLLGSNLEFHSLTAFPFEVFGILALSIILLMAVTSHDYWQKNLGRDTWKTLHMLVYVAYAFVVLHVALGFIQSEHSPFYFISMLFGLCTVSLLHIITGYKEVQKGKQGKSRNSNSWISVGKLEDIPEDRAITICTKTEKIAVYRYNNNPYAVTNLCAHQGGPLGEGKIIDGCITCPWHGWQYKPEDGMSPPPFEEKVDTYPTKVENGMVYVSPDVQRKKNP